MEEFKKKILKIVEQRQLCSYMNDTKWSELRKAVLEEMPFSPPFTIKWVYDSANPDSLQEDVYYLGDWQEALGHEDHVHGIAIEWMKVRPRYLKHQGKLMPPEVIDASEQFENILINHNIPYEVEEGVFCIYGYK